MEPPKLSANDYLLGFKKDKVPYEKLFKQAMADERFWRLNTHLTSKEKKGLKKPAGALVFPKKKPMWYWVACKGETSYYCQINPPDFTSKVDMHRIAGFYNYLFIQDKELKDLIKDLPNLEASHLMNNYIGHQRDFNPNNIAMERGFINKTRESCALRSALRTAKTIQGDAFDYDSFIKLYCDGAYKETFALSQSAATQESIPGPSASIQGDALLGLINQKLSQPTPSQPTLTPADLFAVEEEEPEAEHEQEHEQEPEVEHEVEHDCCGEIHNPSRKRYKSAWGQLPSELLTHTTCFGKPKEPKAPKEELKTKKAKQQPKEQPKSKKPKSK